jgi:hypothetical protein
MMTVALPLSAGSMVMSGAFLRSLKALASSLVMLDVVGLGWLKMCVMVLCRSAASGVLGPMSLAACSVVVM